MERPDIQWVLFKTLAEAEAFKKNLIDKEPDAAASFVTVFFFWCAQNT